MVGSREARSMPLITFFPNTDALLDAYCKVLELSTSQAREENGRVAKKRASEKQREERQRTCEILFKYLSPPTSSYQNVKMCGEGRLHTLTMFV